MAPDTVTLEEAVQLLILPRALGVDPTTARRSIAANGRYGPYVKKGAESRSIESEEQLLTMTLEEALALLASPEAARPPRRPRRRSASSATDPVSEKPIVVKDGRFGPYVTDGETNASLRAGDDVESITDERAAELLADPPRNRGPPSKHEAPRSQSGSS